MISQNIQKQINHLMALMVQKLVLYIKNEKYMLKFPSGAKWNNNMSYSNSSISEYLGSHILQTLGFETQQTILGTYEINNQKN